MAAAEVLVSSAAPAQHLSRPVPLAAESLGGPTSDDNDAGRPGVSPDYYLELLQFLIASVQYRRADLLRGIDRDWWSRLRGCEVAAQRLYVRLLLRRGTVFRSARLAYPEVPDCATALQTLVRRGLAVAQPNSTPAAVLELLPLAEIRQLFPEYRGRRAERLAMIHKDCPPTAVRARLAAADIHWFALLGRAQVERLQLAWFGNRRQSLTDLITTEVGITRYPRYAISGRPLRNRWEVDAWLESGRARSLARPLAREGHPGLLIQLGRRAGQSTATRISSRWRRLDSDLGRNLERCGDSAAALWLHRRAATAESHERMVRILRAATDGAGVDQWVAGAPAGWWSGPAQRRRVQRLAGLPVSGQEPPVEVLDVPFSQPVELAVAGVLRRTGASAWWVENALLSTLFSLIFREQIFAPVAGAFAHAWQQAPLDLRSPQFRQNRPQGINQILSVVRQGGALAVLADQWARYRGLGCAGVHWQLPWGLLRGVVERLGAGPLANLLDYLADDPGRCLRGWPDLVVLDSTRLSFVEVKGPKDQLRDAQRDRLAVLSQVGVDARVVQVRWADDS